MLASPCIGVCRIDDALDLCLGCARTRVEVATWREMTEEARQIIWAQLPARREELGLKMHRLPWEIDELRAFIAGTLRPGRGASSGTWTMGLQGAIAEFSIGADEPCDVDVDDASVQVATARGAIAFKLSKNLRAFSTSDDAGRNQTIMLGVHRSFVSAAPQCLTCLGADRDAIREDDRDDVLYDFGLGRIAASFCIRTSDADLRARLDDVAGLPWQKFLAVVGKELLRHSPPRVVRTPAGRLEVFAAIPPSDGVSPSGPHTHFLPDVIERGRDLPEADEISPGFLRCATFYPAG